MALIELPGLDEFPSCKKAFEELEQIASQDAPDKAKMYSLARFLQERRDGTEWVMLEDAPAGANGFFSSNDCLNLKLYNGGPK